MWLSPRNQREQGNSALIQALDWKWKSVAAICCKISWTLLKIVARERIKDETSTAFLLCSLTMMNYSFHSNNFDAFLIGVVGSSRQQNNSWTGVRREEWTYVRVAIIIVLSIHRIRNAEKCRRTTWFFAEILRVPIRFDSVTEFRLFVFIFIRSLLNSVSWEKICWDFEEIYFQLHILTRPYLCSFVRSLVRSFVLVCSVCCWFGLPHSTATNFESERNSKTSF